MHRTATCAILFLFLGAAIWPADAQEPAAKEAPIEVTLTELEPERDAFGKLPEGWDEERLERAGGLFFQGKRSNVGRFVRHLEQHGEGKKVFVLCDPTLPWHRLRSLFRVLNHGEVKLAGVDFATTRRPAIRQPLRLHRANRVTFTIDGNGNFVEEDVVGSGNLVIGEKEDEGKKVNQVGVIIAGDRIVVGETKLEHDDLGARIKALSKAVEEHRAGFDLVRLQLQPADDVSCANLIDIMTRSGADRQVFGDWGFSMISWSRFVRGNMTNWLPKMVDSALAKLKRQQSAGGAWLAEGGSGYGMVGATSLAILAYVGEFHSPTEEGPYQETVERGLRYLLSKQRDNGCLAGAGDGFSFAHVLATYALVETYGITGEDDYLAAAEKALRFLVRCRNKKGVWGLIGADPKADLVVTAWATQALSAADINGLALPEDALERIEAWLDEVLEAKTGRVTLENPTRLEGCVDEFYGRRPESLTTVAALARSRVTSNADADELLLAGLQRAYDAAPDDGNRFGPTDLDTIFFGALLLNAHGDSDWAYWHDGLLDAIGARIRLHDDEATAVELASAELAILTIGLELAYRFTQNVDLSR